MPDEVSIMPEHYHECRPLLFVRKDVIDRLGLASLSHTELAEALSLRCREGYEENYANIPGYWMRCIDGLPENARLRPVEAHEIRPHWPPDQVTFWILVDEDTQLLVDAHCAFTVRFSLFTREDMPAQPAA